MIYSADAPKPVSVKAFKPAGSAFTLVERNDKESEYTYLEGEWEHSWHRTWVGELTRNQFDAFVSDQNLEMETTPTMGSLSERGWQPAIAFSYFGERGIAQAYVTPLPDVSVTHTPEREERYWAMVLRAMETVYANS